MNFISIFGVFILLGIAWLMSYHRAEIKIRPIIWGISLQFLFALIILRDDKWSFFGMIILGALLITYIMRGDKDIQKRPEVENLLGIYSSMNSQSLLKTINEFSGKNFSDLKQKLTEIVVEKISPISNEINKLQKDPKFIDDVLQEGSQKAEQIARKKVEKMKKIIGF